MTNSVAASIRAGLLVGMFAAGADPTQAQNLTFFRTYNIPPPGTVWALLDSLRTVEVLCMH